MNIYRNDALRSVSGFAILDGVRGDLTIYSNNALRSMSGFAMLESVRRTLGIAGFFDDETSAGNPMLSSLPDFASLNSIGVALLDNR